MIFVTKIQNDRKSKFNITSETLPKIAEIGNTLTISEKKKVNECLKSNNLGFAFDKYDLGQIFGFEFRIDLKDPEKICYVPPRAIPPGIRDEAEVAFQDWQKRDMVTESKSQHNSLLIITRKDPKKQAREFR